MPVDDAKMEEVQNSEQPKQPTTTGTESANTEKTTASLGPSTPKPAKLASEVEAATPVGDNQVWCVCGRIGRRSCIVFDE